MNPAIRNVVKAVRKNHGAEIAARLEQACERSTRLATMFDEFSSKQGRLRDAAESIENLQQAMIRAARSADAIGTYLGPRRGLELEFRACRRLPALLVEVAQCAQQARSELGEGKRAGGRPANTKAFAVAWQLSHSLRPARRQPPPPTPPAKLTARSTMPIVRSIMTAMDFEPAQIESALRAVRKHAGWDAKE